MEKIRTLIIRCLIAAKKEIDELADGEKIIKQGSAFGDSANDTDIKADKAIGETIKKIILAERIAGKITIEGLPDTFMPRKNPDEQWYGFCIDPLDGSLNYRTRGNTIGLPFSSCITVFDRSVTAFGDVIAAGVIDLRSEDLWLAWKDKDGLYHTTLNGKTAITMQDEILDLGSMIVIGEMYYPSNREILTKAFPEKGWLRNPGSSAYEMALVSSGQATAYISGQQKHHELGAGYALVKGAGGVAVDFNGKDLETQFYNFNSQSPAILAANRGIACQILQKFWH